MSVAYGSSESVGWANFDGAAQSHTITKPTSLAAGDLLVAVMAGLDTADVDTPSGWTQIAAGSVGTTGRITVVAKVADAGDAAASNFTFTWNGGVLGGAGLAGCGILYRFTSTGTLHVNAILTDGGTDNAASTTRTFTGGVTQVVADAVLVMSVFHYADAITLGTYAVTSGNPTWTERVDQSTALGDEATFSSATGPRAAVGATGDFSVVLSTDDGSNSTLGNLLCIQETQNATVNPAVISKAKTINAPTITGGASVSPAVIAKSKTVNAPTVSTPTNKITNTPKSNTSPTITNVPKTDP